MKHITDEEVQTLENLCAAFGTATHLMRLQGSVCEAECFEKDRRTLEHIIFMVRHR